VNELKLFVVGESVNRFKDESGFMSSGYELVIARDKEEALRIADAYSLESVREIAFDKARSLGYVPGVTCI
jgi:hypothetical protein